MRTAILLFSACLVLVTGAQAQDLRDCYQQPGQNGGGGRFGAAWLRMTSAVVGRPNERQRLAEIRTKLIDLSREKKTLIETLKLIVDRKDVPAWLEARIKEIPALQLRIQSLSTDIIREAREGGMLSGAVELNDLLQLLQEKKVRSLCELASIPLPVRPDDIPRVNRLFDDLNNEVSAIDKLDQVIAKMLGANRK